MKLRPSSAGRLVVFIALAALLGTVGVKAQYRSVSRTRTEVPSVSATGSGPGKRFVVGPGSPTGTNPLVPTRPGLSCTGDNGGATDVGVTRTSIKLASTMVRTGIGRSFLGLSPVGMQAAVHKVNRAGGICGRILDLRLVDDGWDGSRGQGFIQNFIKEGYFALPVVPSSEGLTLAIKANDIDRAKIPVVGTDGMLREQYASRWVWPVATATTSTMRIMAKHGYQRGARSFAIVYDRFYKFGKEGAKAFRNYVGELAGASVKAFVGIQPGQASYSAEIQQFNNACKAGCDFVAMLLEPSTAETWIAGHPAFGTKITSGAQTLFNERFANNCAAACHGMLVWTGYNPPIGNLVAKPGVRQYVNDVRSINPTVDEFNQFLEGAYLGMSVFTEALRLVGPNLTREGLRQVLDAMSYTGDLSAPLAWSSTSARGHKANVRAQAFSMVVAGGSFQGFTNARTGFIEDPHPERIGIDER